MFWGSVGDMYMLSGCELIDTENISLPSQNMKFGGDNKYGYIYICIFAGKIT
jgi:hypothetical protein